MTSGKLSEPPPKLVPLLEKHGLSWEVFRKRGRPPKGVVEKRRALITELHNSGMPWLEMSSLTGFSLMGIQRLTQAVGNFASHTNRVENATRIGKLGRGGKKPWLSSQLQADWLAGKFDFHKGRTRPPEEIEIIRLANMRPEVRQRKSESQCRRWQRPEERAKLLTFHRSEEERLRRSEAQSLRLAEDPVKWTRGVGAWVHPQKCSKSRIWTRSSYERIVAGILDRDPKVAVYSFEPRIQLTSRRWILPDFVVTYTDGHVVLLEIKASWVLSLPSDHKVQRRLCEASSYALTKGWGFAIWTEKDFEPEPKK